MIWAAVILGACTAAVAILYYLAPLGWEDKDGWHPGEPPEDI